MINKLSTDYADATDSKGKGQNAQSKGHRAERRAEADEATFPMTNDK